MSQPTIRAFDLPDDQLVTRHLNKLRAHLKACEDRLAASSNGRCSLLLLLTSESPSGVVSLDHWASILSEHWPAIQEQLTVFLAQHEHHSSHQGRP